MSPFRPVLDLLTARVRAGELPGWALSVRHRGAAEHHVGGHLDLGGRRLVTPDTPWRLASVTKLFAGVLAAALVEDGTLDPAAPVARWLPELAGPRVLPDRDGPLAATRPATRPVTVDDLLTCTAGFGGVWHSCPLSEAMAASGVAPGPFPPDMSPGTYLARLGALPLAAQPGESWLYHTASDVLGVVLARATGRSVADLLDERVFRPLGLAATGFHAAAAALPTAYWPDAGGVLRLLDAADGRFARPPRFESLATGLLASAHDVLRLLTALADGGGGVLRRDTVSWLTGVAITDEQRGDGGGGILDDGVSWGRHCAVVVGDRVPGRRPGSFGWDGGTGTSAWVDPSRDLAVAVLTGRGVEGDVDAWSQLWRTIARCADA
ncbi:MAG: serine hydrolase domain-containing protein [Kineosporiaceae bacterium]